MRNSTTGRIAGSTKSPCGGTPHLISLIYELLDAHRDTADLAGGLGPDERWTAHLDYLRALQRMGRRALAEMSSEDQPHGIAGVEAR